MIKNNKHKNNLIKQIKSLELWDKIAQSCLTNINKLVN